MPVIERECATSGGCHGADRTDSVELDLTPGAAYAELVGHLSDVRSSSLRVKPGAPEQSFLINKLTGDLRHDEGKRMPLDADTGTPIEPSPITTFMHSVLVPWIQAGAKND